MKEILDILEKNANTPVEDIAAMTGRDPGEVRRIIREFEEKKVIAGYSAMVNWDKTDREWVVALIEVKVTPQRDRGFDSIAERIYKYNQVKACYLMSGSFDLTVIVEGTNIKEVALFVSEKLSTIEGVTSTSTHFVLKKYKDKNILFDTTESDDREAIVL
ncbi:MAG: Lrp/AsnC family transcriptional regulator [Clostridia bacterium]